MLQAYCFCAYFPKFVMGRTPRLIFLLGGHVPLASSFCANEISYWEFSERNLLDTIKELYLLIMNMFLQYSHSQRHIHLRNVHILFHNRTMVNSSQAKPQRLRLKPSHH
jgi:hypothetical protein